MSRVAIERTTRLTSPEPTGFKKILQDEWDRIRDTQVRTKIALTTDNALKNQIECCMRTIDRLAEGGSSEELVGVYGSYDLTDAYKPNGDENTQARKYLEETMARIRDDPSMILSRYAKKKRVHIVSKGIRTTGTIRFTDGSMEVCDPVKGIQIDGSKTIESIKPVETLYVVFQKI